MEFGRGGGMDRASYISRLTEMKSEDVSPQGHQPVATCEVSDCEYNQQNDCHAQGGIKVTRHSDHADCATYAHK